MQTKAYFASSVPAALEVARKELGENALLVSSKPSPLQSRQFGRLEVTFAWDPQDLPRQEKPRQPETHGQRIEAVPARKNMAAETHPISTPASGMDQILQQLSALRAQVGRGGVISDATEDVTNEDGFVVEKLVENGLPRETAVEIASRAARRPGNPDATVVQELTRRIPLAPFVALRPGENRTLAFIGPPGRGKTTSLVKIAVNLGLAHRVPVRIYCAGEHSVGAQEQVARYAAILGTPFQTCESLATLNLALNGESWKGLVLIDTPGISPADRNELGELTRFFAARPEIEKHLVLRADASSADMLHMISRFTCLTPSRLLFTGMDEAICVAPVVHALIRGGIPGTFAGTGQQIPEDLEELNADKLAREVWGAATPSQVTVSAVANARAARATA